LALINHCSCDGLECFVGVALGSKFNSMDVGAALMPCPEGMCSNVTLNVHNTAVSIYSCDPFDVCATLHMNNECEKAGADMSLCCCDLSDHCNVKNWIYSKWVDESPSTHTDTPPEPTTFPYDGQIECYAGIDLYERLSNDISSLKLISGALQSQTHNADFSTFLDNDAGLVVKMNCTGACANITLGSEGMLYYCDAISLCNSYELTDNCANIDKLLKTCCCSSPLCNKLNLQLGDQNTEAPILSTTFLDNSKVSSSLPIHCLSIICLFFAFNFNLQ
uniref:ET module n=1 Tax=Rhabditophanes sp. KR3021 TaxID=114890 RepID=A0AC35U8M0_9BILA